MRPIVLTLLIALWPAPHARAQDVAAAIRGERWAEAEQLAAAYADPVARKLVVYYRMVAPNAARAAEIAAFIADNPDWPNQTLLTRRLQEAVATEADDAAVLGFCGTIAPVLTGALLRCADAAARVGPNDDAATYARKAWITGLDDPAAELAFMRVWGRFLTPEDHWRRFDRLAWNDKGASGGPRFAADRSPGCSTAAVGGGALGPEAWGPNRPSARRQPAGLGAR